MNCKLSRESLIELQLIPPKLINDNALCPCCKQRVAEHRNTRRIGRIPFTRYNICPRMRRACRKTSVVAIVIGTVVAFVVFLLSSSISYLLAIRGDQDKNFINDAIAYSKKLSSIDYLPNTDKPFAVSSSSSRSVLIDDEFERKNRNQTIPSVVFWPTFRLILIILTFILVYLGLLRFIIHLKNRKRRDGEQGIPIPVTIYISAATQTSFN